MKYATGLIILIFVSLLAFCGWQAYSFLHYSQEAEGREILFDVPQGSAFSQVAADLAKKGIVSNARYFSWYAKLKKVDHKLQAGRFALNTGWTAGQILDALVNGKPVLYRVTVPEGLTWWQTARLLEKEGFVRFDEFRDAILDRDFLRHHGIPFDSAEGFLMPDTYLFKKPDPGANSADKDAEEWTRQSRAVAARMIDNFWRKTSPIWSDSGAKADAYGIARPDAATLKRAVILASIVEKETALAQERPRVAGVYANRLARNMRLQADPTVIYGVGPDFSGALKRSQLDDAANGYNTYQHEGLPPGPICSTGVASIKAAINPEAHDYLYFVAKSDALGGHTFSRTLDEHNRAVGDYRRQKRSR